MSPWCLPCHHGEVWANGGADELVAPEEDIIALSVGIASSPHTHILHQSKVVDLGEEHGRGGRENQGRLVYILSLYAQSL